MTKFRPHGRNDKLAEVGVFGPYVGLSPKHGDMNRMERIFRDRLAQEQLFYKHCRERGCKLANSDGVLSGFEVFRNATYTETVDTRPQPGPFPHAATRRPAAPLPQAAAAPFLEAPSPVGDLPQPARTLPPDRPWVPGAAGYGLPRRKVAPCEPPPRGPGAPGRSLEAPKYALTRYTMGHMTELHPVDVGPPQYAQTQYARGNVLRDGLHRIALARSAPDLVGDPAVGRAARADIDAPAENLQTHVKPQGFTLPKYALARYTMGHMKEHEENPNATKSGRRLQKVLSASKARSGSSRR